MFAGEYQHEKMYWFLKERVRTRERFHRLNYGNKYKLVGEQKSKVIKRYFEKYPQKKLAKNITSNAIRDGKLIKQPCEICSEVKVQAHHDDYSKPLEIRWLCVKHHNEYHKQLRDELLFLK